MSVWVVVAVLGAGAAAAAMLSRRRSDDVEPTVREFAEFRDAISRQVASTAEQTAETRRHVDGTSGRWPSDPPSDRSSARDNRR